MLVGEALGEDESLLEQPFVGRCGQLLDQILKEAGIDRDSLHITNTVKCRPVKKAKFGQRFSNRPPTDEEINTCKGWLFQELELVRPDIVITLGKIPTYTLLSSFLKKSFKLGDVVGTVYQTLHTNIIPAYHPSYLMVHGKDKMDETIELFRKVVNEHSKVLSSW